MQLHWFGALPQIEDLMLFGSPNNAKISSELIPWCNFMIFSVLKDEGRADIDIVSQDASKGASKIKDIRQTRRISIAP